MFFTRVPKHFIPLWGQQLGRCYRRHSNLRNISYPYGDSNNVCGSTPIAVTKHFIPLWGQQRDKLRDRLRGRVETFHTPMGTATAIVCTSVYLCTETFRTPMGTATFSVIHRRTLRRNISYPYGDSNLENGLVVSLVIETFHTPTGTATISALYRFTRPHETFHTHMGTATS